MRRKMAIVNTGRDIEMRKHPESVRFKNILEHINFYFKAFKRVLSFNFNQDLHSNENSEMMKF